MRYLRVIIAGLLLVIVGAPIIALAASNIDDALFYGRIIVTNEDTAATNVATTANISTTVLQDGGYLNSGATDCVIRSSAGADLPFMPGYTPDGNPWAIWVPSIGTNSILTDILYTADSSGGDINYFPAAGGMAVSDNDTLELGADFLIEQRGWVQTIFSDNYSDRNLVYKESAFRTYISGATDITSEVTEESPFPTVAATNGGNNPVNNVNHTVNLPVGGGINAGDLLLVFFISDTGSAGVTFPGGWTQLFSDTWADNFNYSCHYRIADGGEGATITVVTGNVQMSAHTTYRITGYEGVPEASANVNANSANPNPASLTPSWGLLNTLWFAVTGYDDGTTTVNGYPAGYGNTRNDRSNNAEGTGIGTARLELKAISEDPGTFTLSGAENWGANVVAIRPATVTHSVTATPITSGVRTVKTTYDGADLKIFVYDEDSILIDDDTTAWVGTVFPNNEHWAFVENSSMLYMEYTSIEKGGTPVAYWGWEYANTFTDSVNSIVATPTFRSASSDADVTAELVSFAPVSEAKAPSYALDDPDPFLTPDTANVTSAFTTEPPAGTFPLAGVIAAIANATTTPPQLPLLIIAAFIILAISLSFSAITRQYGAGPIFIKVLLIAGVMGIFVALGDFGIDFWMIVVFLMIGISLSMASRQLGWT